MSYLKKHWFECLVGITCLGLAIYYLIALNVGAAILWIIASAVWIGCSRTNYTDERIEELELKAKKYDALTEEVKALRELQQTYEKLNEQRFKNLEAKNESSRTLYS